MFARIRDCLYRNRGRIAAVGAAIGAAVAVRELLAWRYQLAEEAAAEEQRAAVRHEQLFQSNQQTCASAEEKLVPHIAERFETLMDIRTLQEQLRDQQSDRLTLWYQLKLCSFARTVSSVYALSILGTYIHLQLHLVGGHLLRDLAAPDSPNLVTADVQHTYLSLVEHFLQHGLESLVGLIHPIVEKVVGALVLTENLGPATVHELFKQIRQLVDAKPEILKEALRAPLPDQPPPALVALVTESLELCEHPLFLLSIRMWRAGVVGWLVGLLLTSCRQARARIFFWTWSRAVSPSILPRASSSPSPSCSRLSTRRPSFSSHAPTTLPFPLSIHHKRCANFRVRHMSAVSTSETSNNSWVVYITIINEIGSDGLGLDREIQVRGSKSRCTTTQSRAPSGSWPCCCCCCCSQHWWY
eukprot:m.183505 g.183505  ORF g.183505 m.183505 type:complete len:414 (+) comp10496_c0_seq6:2984-4225(+)